MLMQSAQLPRPHHPHRTPALQQRESTHHRAERTEVAQHDRVVAPHGRRRAQVLRRHPGDAGAATQGRRRRRGHHPRRRRGARRGRRREQVLPLLVQQRDAGDAVAARRRRVVQQEGPSARRRRRRRRGGSWGRRAQPNGRRRRARGGVGRLPFAGCGAAAVVLLREAELHHDVCVAPGQSARPISSASRWGCMACGGGAVGCGTAAAPALSVSPR